MADIDTHQSEEIETLNAEMLQSITKKALSDPFLLMNEEEKRMYRDIFGLCITGAKRGCSSVAINILYQFKCMYVPNNVTSALLINGIECNHEIMEDGHTQVKWM